MHACIAAVSQSVPTVCIAYSDKFIGVMESIGVEDIVVDARAMDKDEILRAIGGALDQHEEVRRLLQTKMPEVRSSILNLLVSASRTDRKDLEKNPRRPQLISA